MSKDNAPPVVLLCGGLGMRMREETEFKPKPMVEIGGRPILWHIMRHYERYGFRRFIVCLGYKGDRIREYFLNYEHMNNDFTISLGPGQRAIEIHRSFAGGTEEAVAGWEVTLAETGPTAMTGARIKRIERYIDSEYFFCTYGDGLSNIDLNALLSFHRSHGKTATITGVAPLSRFGALVTDGQKVTAFAEKPEISDSLVNGGFFVFDRRVFSYLTDDDSCVLEHEPFVTLARENQMMAYQHSGYWQCMDTPRDVQQLNEEWRKAEPGWLRPVGKR